MLVHWGEWGKFFLATVNVAFSYPDSQYMPQCKSKTTAKYLWQNLLIQEFLHLLQKAIKTWQGACSTSAKRGLQLVVDFHGDFSGSKSITPSWKGYLRKPLSPEVTLHAAVAGSHWMWEGNLWACRCLPKVTSKVQLRNRCSCCQNYEIVSRQVSGTFA